jgi:hypothetical protein
VGRNKNNAMTDVVKLMFDVEEGNASALDAFCHLTRLEKQIKAAKDQIQSQAINEAQMYGKTFQHMGFEIQCRSGAGRWKFDHLDEWVVAKNQLATVEDMAKWAYKSEEKGVMPVTDGGEIITAAVYVAGSDTIALKEIGHAE